MSDLDTSNTGPTPLDMPGAAAGEARGEQTGGDTAAADQADSPTYDDLLAERDKWKSAARNNEKRAKANAEKAKAFDADFEKFKAAYEREQLRQQQGKTPEEIKAEASAEAAKRVEEAEAARAEAEAKLLRLKLSDGVPEFAMGLITGTTEDEITEQVAEVKTALAQYVSQQVGEPRRPAPNPLAGRGGQNGTSAREEFGALFSKLL